MRLAAFFAFASLVVPGAFAQQASPQPTIAFPRAVGAEVAPAARGYRGPALKGTAEQLRLNALAYLGLGKTHEAEKAVEKLVALVPGYTPHPADPAPFAALVARVVRPATAPAVLVAGGN